MYNFERNKILIVGAGIAGCTLGRILAENNFNVLIIDKRKHIAGNVFDFVNNNNERIHKYGPHLLHCRRDSEALVFLSKSLPLIGNFLMDFAPSIISLQ